MHHVHVPSIWFLGGMKYTTEQWIFYNIFLLKSFTHDLERVLQCVKSITPNKGSKVREINCHTKYFLSC